MANFKGRVIGAFLSVLLFASASWGVEDDDEFFHEITRAPAEYSLRLSYDGARDEQPLEIQAVLPQPSRSPDGVPNVYDITGTDISSYD